MRQVQFLVLLVLQAQRVLRDRQGPLVLTLQLPVLRALQALQGLQEPQEPQVLQVQQVPS